MENTQENIKSFSDIRNLKAKEILDVGSPEIIDEFTYLVPSQNNPTLKYHVTHIDTYSCECKDFQYNCKGKGLYCKHIKAIILFQNIKAQYEVKPEVEKEIELIIEKPLENHCPYCNSDKLIKRGVRLTQLGEKQRYSCNTCKKRFVLSAIPKIKGNAKLVCLAMDCYYKGLSYRDIADQFKQFYGLNISHEAIRGWVLRFSQTMEKYAKTIKPQNQSNIWNSDETLILSKRGKDKANPNTEFDYVWNTIDNKTKFLLASECSHRSRSIKDAKHEFEVAYAQNGKIPYQIIVDGYKGYQEACLSVFKNWGNQRKVKFTSIKGHRKEVNNNAVENHNSHQKEFHKVRRGVTETQIYQDGFKVFHNFVRKGTADKLTPAQRCGIGIKGNAWETLLVNSIRQVPNLTKRSEMIKSP